jgi:predicted ATPase
MGKTRLATVAATAAADRFPFGGAFVDLVPACGGVVIHAVASALGVSERAATALEDALHERLGEGRMLVVLDNCEHVLDAAARFVDHALARSAALVVLATSREPLGVPGERVLRVPPLDVESDAERLFEDRVVASDPGFAADPSVVADICRRLGGMPLAIELAAARAASLGADGLLSGLHDHLRLHAAGSGEDRHRSMRAVIDWSPDLLDDEERAVFRSLAVFQGGFDLPAVAAVATDGDVAVAADVVGRLTDKSLLVPEDTAAGRRWRMLETVHAYAHERLDESGEKAAVTGRYVDWAAATAIALEQQLEDGGAWAVRFDVVADDLRAAATPEPPYGLAMAIGHLTYAFGYLAEAQQHYEAAIRVAPDASAAAEAAIEAAHVAWSAMRADIAFELLIEASRCCGGAWRAKALADAVMLAERMPAEFDEPIPHDRLTAMLDEARAAAPAGDPDVEAHLAIAAAWNGCPEPSNADGPLAAAALEAARAVDDPVLVVGALDAVASAAIGEGRYHDAAVVSAQRLDLLPRLARHRPAVGGEVGDLLHMASETALLAGDLPSALERARLARRELQDRGIPHMVAVHHVVPLVLQGRFAEAQAEARIMRDAWERAGSPPATWLTPAVHATALSYELQGDDDEAARWHEFADRVGASQQSFDLFARFRLGLYRGDLPVVLALEAEFDDDPMRQYCHFARAVLAEAAVIAGDGRAAELVEVAARLGAENDWVAAYALRAAGRLAGDRSLVDASVRAWEALDAPFERAVTLTLLDDRRAEGIDALAALGCAPPAV